LAHHEDSNNLKKINYQKILRQHKSLPGSIGLINPKVASRF